MTLLQKQIGDLDRELSDPTLFERDAAKGAKLSQKRAQLDVDLQSAEEEWLGAQDELEQVTGGRV